MGPDQRSLRPSDPRAFFRALGTRPKRYLGQHFLIDSAAAQRIATIVNEPSSNGDGEFHILEIGAGTGALTTALAQRDRRLTAIEIDADLVRFLRGLPELSAVQIVQADALAFDYAQFGSGSRWRVTGNLPYNIGTPLLLHLIEMQAGPDQIIVMLQKDVADRLAARPATPAYGSLTLATQYAMRVERVFSLGPHAFYPRPKVDSTVVRMIRHPQAPVHTANAQFLLQVTRAAFAYRRKTLANSLRLALGIEPARTSSALKSIGLGPEVRGEELELAQFAAIADHLHR